MNKDISYLVIPLIVLLSMGISFPHWSDDTVIITITDKGIKVVDNQSKYLIFTENETFENTDCFFCIKLNLIHLIFKDN